MFRLREQVAGHDFGVCRLIGDHKNLCGTSQKINPDDSEELTLRLGDIGVAWSSNHVDWLDLSKAEGKSGHGLDATQAQDFIRPAEVNCNQGGRRHDLSSRWRNGNHPGHACLSRRDKLHEYGSNEREIAARDVTADGVYGQQTMAQNDPWSKLCTDLAKSIALDPCKGGHLVPCKTNGIDLVPVDHLVCSFDIPSTDAEAVWIPVIVLMRVPADGGFAFQLNVADNPGHSFDHLSLPVGRRLGRSFDPANADRRRLHYASHNAQIRAGDPVHPLRRSGIKTTPNPLCIGIRSMLATTSVWLTRYSACTEWLGYERSAGLSVDTASVRTLTTP